MDNKHHDKKKQTLFERFRVAMIATLRRSSSSQRKQPGTPSNRSICGATPSSSRSPSPVAAKQGLTREENKNKIKHKGLMNWKRGEKSIQNPVNQSEQQMSTAENIIDQIWSRIEEQPETTPVKPETVAAIQPNNASETAESESYTSARSSASKLLRDRPNTQRKIKKKKQQKDQSGNILIESHRSIRTITISASSHKSEISQIHSEASLSEQWQPGGFQASQLNVNVLEVPRIGGRTDESHVGQSTTPLTVVGFHIVVSSTYLPSADSADAPVCNQMKVAAPKNSAHGARGNTNPLPGPPLESECARKPCTTTKETKKNTPPKGHNTTRIENTHKQVHGSLQDTCAQRTTRPAVQSMRRLPTQSAVTPENGNMLSKVPPYTKSVPEGKRSQAAARTNTPHHDPTDKFKTRVVLLKKKISNHKVNPTKNRQITTPPNKQQSGGQKTNVSNRCQSQSQPQNCQGSRNTRGQGPSKSKPNNAFLPTDPSGSSMDRPRSSASNRNDSQVRPHISRAGSSSRSMLLSESKLNKPRAPMESLVRPKTTLANVCLPNASLNSNTNKIHSPSTQSADTRQEEVLRRDDYKRMELLFTNTRSSAAHDSNSSANLHTHGLCQVTDRTCTSWCCCAEIIAKPNLSTSTVRQTTSFPYTRAERVERLPIVTTTPSDNRIVIPVPLIRERTYLVLPSIKPLGNVDTLDENNEAVTTVLRRENTFLIQPSFNFGKLTAKPKTKIKKTSTSTPMFRNNKTSPAPLGPGRITSEILSKTESTIPLTKESTYLILPRTNISRRAESSNRVMIPLKKKSTYVVISQRRSNSGLKLHRTTSKIPLLRSYTYQVIQSKKTHSMPNIG